MVQSHSLMSLPAIPATALANISAPFQQSASMTSAESDPLFPQFSLSFYQQELQGPKYLGGAKSVPLTSDRFLSFWGFKHEFSVDWQDRILTSNLQQVCHQKSEINLRWGRGILWRKWKIQSSQQYWFQGLIHWSQHCCHFKFSRVLSFGCIERMSNEI